MIRVKRPHLHKYCLFHLASFLLILSSKSPMLLLIYRQHLVGAQDAWKVTTPLYTLEYPNSSNVRTLSIEMSSFFSWSPIIALNQIKTQQRCNIWLLKASQNIHVMCKRKMRHHHFLATSISHLKSWNRISLPSFCKKDESFHRKNK